MFSHFFFPRVLCETVRAFVARVSQSHDSRGEGEKDTEDSEMGTQFQVLNEKLQSLLDTLNKEEKESKVFKSVWCKHLVRRMTESKMCTYK